MTGEVHGGAVKQQYKGPSQIEDSASSEVLVLGGMFHIVRHMRLMSWSVVKNVMAEQRPLLIRFDDRWK
jgi:hypothetical protein